MPDRKVLFMRCKKCKAHAHWTFGDGSKSDEFYTTAGGALEFMQAIVKRKVSADEIPRALGILKQSSLPTTESPVPLIGEFFVVTMRSAKPFCPLATTEATGPSSVTRVVR